MSCTDRLADTAYMALYDKAAPARRGLLRDPWILELAAAARDDLGSRALFE